MHSVTAIKGCLQIFSFLSPLSCSLRLLSSAPPSIHPEGRPGDVRCLSPVWNLRAVIWFPFPISSLAFLPCPLALSVLSFFCYWSSPVTNCCLWLNYGLHCFKPSALKGGQGVFDVSPLSRISGLSDFITPLVFLPSPLALLSFFR